MFSVGLGKPSKELLIKCFADQKDAQNKDLFFFPNSKAKCICFESKKWDNPSILLASTSLESPFEDTNTIPIRTPIFNTIELDFNESSTKSAVISGFNHSRREEYIRSTGEVFSHLFEKFDSVQNFNLNFSDFYESGFGIGILQNVLLEENQKATVCIHFEPQSELQSKTESKETSEDRPSTFTDTNEDHAKKELFSRFDYSLRLGHLGKIADICFICSELDYKEKIFEDIFSDKKLDNYLSQSKFLTLKSESRETTSCFESIDPKDLISLKHQIMPIKKSSLLKNISEDDKNFIEEAFQFYESQ